MKKFSAARPNILSVLIVSLAAVALLRAGNVWIGFNSATAQSGDAILTAPQAENNPALAAAPLSASSGEPLSQTPAPAPAPVPAPVLGAAPIEASPSGAERRLLSHLAARREALDRREAELEIRAQLLAAAEVTLEGRLKQLEEEAAALRALRSERQQAETEEYAALSSAYERMKPREAARIFNVLDDDILVPVAAGMRTQAIAGVLAQMQPEKARALTRKLAQRSAAAAPRSP